MLNIQKSLKKKYIFYTSNQAIFLNNNKYFDVLIILHT